MADKYLNLYETVVERAGSGRRTVEVATASG
jgi:hypothetical protein